MRESLTCTQCKMERQLAAPATRLHCCERPTPHAGKRRRGCCRRQWVLRQGLDNSPPRVSSPALTANSRLRTPEKRRCGCCRRQRGAPTPRGFSPPLRFSVLTVIGVLRREFCVNAANDPRPGVSPVAALAVA